MQFPHYGINRRQLDALLIALGGEVIALHRTGEVVYRHPFLPARPRADGRRKDAPAHLVKFVRQLMHLLGLVAKTDSHEGAA